MAQDKKRGFKIETRKAAIDALWDVWNYPDGRMNEQSIRAIRQISKVLKAMDDDEWQAFSDLYSMGIKPRKQTNDINSICYRCGHTAMCHEVDDEELRECRECDCKQFQSTGKILQNIQDNYSERINRLEAEVATIKHTLGVMEWAEKIVKSRNDGLLIEDEKDDDKKTH